MFTTLVSDGCQEVLPALLPFYHIYGLLSLAIGSLYYGQKIITIPKFEPVHFLSSIAKNKVNIKAALKSHMWWDYKGGRWLPEFVTGPSFYDAMNIYMTSV